MPFKPKTPCRHPGCPTLTDGSYCEQHQKEMDALYNKYQRDPTTRKRYGKHWKHIRDRYIIAHPLCEKCFKDAKITKAQEVHHVIPLSNGGNHDTDNLMSLCKSCHSTITAREGGRWGK